MSCLVEVEQLRYTYPQGRAALDRVGFHLRHGERVGLIGPNGAGKTTLLLALAGLLEVFEGTISVAGAQWFHVDTPFAGYKQSGLGRENGRMGFEEYLETKVIAVPGERTGR